jgi:AcrR family transcriptional regulator
MAPKTSQQFAEIRQKSQEKIEAAALALFAEQGFHNTSITAIAKAASISKGLLYNYYKSKEDLLHQIIDRAMEGGEEMIDTFINADLSPYEKVAMLVEGSVQMIINDPHHWKLMTALALQKDVIDSLRDKIEQKKEDMITIAGAVFKQMDFSEPEKEALFLGACLDGILIQYISLGPEYPIEQMKNYLLSRYQPKKNA